MKELNFYLPKIETRSTLSKGVKQYIVRGYAATAGNIYPYDKLSSNGRGDNPIASFKEFFTDKAIENIKRKAKSEKIWVDYGHHRSFGMNMQKALSDIETRSGLNLKEEKAYAQAAFKVGDIPMFKLNDIQIDDKGLFVEIHGNPFYREVDEEHQKYFDAIWGSLENGFINGMSLNMIPTDFIPLNENLNQINDVDVYGISLVSGASNEAATITEVVVRCCMNRGDESCQKKMQMISLLI